MDEPILWKAHVPLRYQEAHIDSLPVTYRGPVREWFESLEEKWYRDMHYVSVSRPVEGRNLVLQGPVGVGKTYMMYTIARLMGTEGIRSGDISGRNDMATWMYLPLPQFYAAARAFDTEVARVAKEVDVLFLDDIGASRTSDFTLDNLLMLLSHRWTHQMPVVAATNLSTVVDKGGESALDRAIGVHSGSRLLDGALILDVRGANRRLGG